MTSFKIGLASVAALPVILAGWIAPLAGAAALMAAGPAAADNCEYHVGAPGQGDYVICHPDPSPRPVPHSPVPHYSVYAVIAGSDRTGYSTMVWHYEQLEQAKTAALSKCARMASDCQLRDWTEHCVAEAESADHRMWGVAADWLMDNAADGAVKQCRLGGGAQCKVTVHHCADDTP